MERLFYLGIDGGGTKTEAVGCDREGLVIHREVIGPTNPNDVGISKAISELTGLIARFHDALSEECAISVFCGIAGALNHKDALINALQSAFPDDLIAVDSDGVSLLCSEVPFGDGCCLVAGTGSVCFVRQGDRYLRIGGWGYLLDGAGSGFSMGREALEAVLKTYDGRGEATLLRGAVTDLLGGAPWEKLTEIYEGGKPLIASLAPAVFACEAIGDKVSYEIIDRQALYLAACLDTAYRSAGSEGSPFTAVLGGGLFHESSVLTERIACYLTTPVTLCLGRMPQVFGAVSLAAMAVMGEERMRVRYDRFRGRFAKSYAEFCDE